jgi:O-antigen/teichoic acid export membrane protein
MLQDLTRLLRHSGIYLLGNVLNRLGAFVLLPLYTSQLPVADYGALEILYSTVAILSVIFAAGLSHTTLRFYFEEKTDQDKAAVVTTSLTMVILLGSLGAAAVFAVRQPLTELLFDSQRFITALTICLIIMVLEMATEVGFAYMRAREKSTLYVALSFARLLLQVGLSVYLVKYQSQGIDGVLKANLASVALGCAVVVGYAIWNCGWKFNQRIAKPMLHYSLPMAGGAVVAAIAMNVDRFLIKELLSLDAVGIYALAMKFALLLSFIVSEPFSRAYGPFRFSILNNDNAAEIQSLVVQGLVVAASTVALGVALFMPEVLYILAGKAYQSSYLYTPFLLASVVVSAAAYCFETGILVKKKTKYLLYISIACLVAKIILNLALIPMLALYGAAIAYFCTCVLHAFLINFTSQKLIPVAYPYGALWRVGILAALAYTASYSLDFRNWSVSVPLKLLLIVAFLVATYAMDEKLRTIIRRAVPAFRKEGAK